MRKIDHGEDRCCGRVFNGRGSHRCLFRATVTRNGKPYCGTHDPERKATRLVKIPDKYRKLSLRDVIPRDLKPGDLPDDPTRLSREEFSGESAPAQKPRTPVTDEPMRP